MSAGARVLPRDVETYSAINLAEVGAHRYATDKSTKIRCVGYAVDNGPVQIWTPGEWIPQPFFDAADNPDWTVVAHHDQFESAIERHILAPHYGWPLVPIERHRCTMTAALAAALPGKLENVAAALKLAHQKGKAGQRLMLRLSRVGYVPTAEELQRLYDYCRCDVEIERELYRRLPPLSDDEQKLWELDARINARGFHVDLQLAEATRKIVHEEEKAINAEIAELTGGKITSIHEVAKITAHLQELGYDVTDLTKKSVSALLAQQPEGDGKRLLELRQQGAQAAARKLDSLIAGIDADQRLRDTLKYHAASTGRWGGRGAQPQNLKKPKTENTDIAVDAIRSGDLDRVRELGAPLAIAGDVSRNMITAAPGHVLMGGDFSAIESRGLAWLAGETWKLDSYRQFDKTGDPKLEPYCVTASKILRREVTPEDESARAVGKVCDLAFGFGGGLGAYRRFDPSNTYTDAQVEAFKREWRSAHAATVRFWHDLENCLCRALRTKQRVVLGNLSAEVVDSMLYLTLPSGRRPAYPEARLEPGKFGKDEIVFKDNARGGWTDCRGWFGTFTENVVQAVARDLLAAAMLRLEAAGYPIVLHVHDEIVAEVPKGFGSTEEFLRLMTAPPDWATGLPVAAKVWTRKCYAKPTATTPPVPFVAIEKPAPKISSHDDAIAGKIIAPSIPLPAQPLLNGKNSRSSHHSGAAHGGAARHQEPLATNKNSAACRQSADDSTLALALQIWNAAQPIAGTSALRYLADIRGIDVDVLPDNIGKTLRFHPRCTFGSGIRLPCLIACYRDVETDEFAGIHRIALTPDVFAGGKVQRLTLGSWPTPRAFKLWPATDQLFLGEGIETVLAAATRLHYRGAPMRPAWAAGSSGNIGKFPVLDDVEALTLLVDHDASGEQCANACRQRWREANRTVTRLQTDRPRTDFNDLVLERRAS
jgi:DNA polymerase